MNHLLKIARSAGIVFMYLGITFSVPVLTQLTSLSSVDNRTKIVKSIAQTDITPLFYTFEGTETPLCRHLFPNQNINMRDILPSLNTPQLKQCAAQYAVGSVAYLQTGTSDEYPSKDDVTAALAEAKKAAQNSVADNWDIIVNSLSQKIYPPEHFFPYLNSSRFKSIRDFEHFKKSMRNFTPQGIVLRFGGMLIGMFCLISLCAFSTKKGMKYSGSALQIGGVLSVLGPAVAYGFLHHIRGGGHEMSETLYYGRFIVNVFGPVIKTAGLTGILCIVSGAALESNARRLLKKSTDESI